MRSFTPLWGASSHKKIIFAQSYEKIHMTLPFPAFFVHAGLQKRGERKKRERKGRKNAVWDELSNPH